MPSDPLSDFIVAACVPLDSGHGSGTIDRAEAILAANPSIATSDILAAAILGDDLTVKGFLARDPTTAALKGGPYRWDPLTHLCFSRYLRIDRTRSAGFTRAAKALLDAGASASTGFYDETHQPQPGFESALYGAAGVAHQPELTRLLLERGADPNDGEVAYHTPEGYDNAALKVLVESGKLTPDTLATMLLRKADWHDGDGMRWLLEHDADPNRMTHWRFTALHQALRRDNALENIDAMLDHGADPMQVNGADGRSAATIAARRGRGDVLELLERRGIPFALHGVDRLIAACARNDSAAATAIAEGEPGMLTELRALGGQLLAEFAGNGNADGVRQFLDFGIDVRAPYEQGDGYFDIARGSTALHVAAWRARHATVKLLIDRGAPVNLPDERGRTPLVLAVRACVDSYWAHRRSAESVEALLHAGASTTGVRFPSGYPEVDALLESHGAAA